MGAWIVKVIAAGGYWGIAFLMALENVIPPIPSELIMGVGGLLVAKGEMRFWPLLVAGTLGSTLGNYAWFLAGDRVGYQRLEPLVRRWGRWLTIEWREVERACEFLRRHGQWVVFALRFSPLFRTMISLPAGLAHMGHIRFLAFTAAGAAVWNAALILGGRALGGWIGDAERWLGWITFAIVAGAVIGYLWRLGTWRRRS